MTHGSRGCVTHIWSRGGVDWKRLSKSRSASAGLRMRSRGPGSVMHSRPRHGPTSTEHPRSSCDGQSLRRAPRSMQLDLVVSTAGVSVVIASEHQGGVQTGGSKVVPIGTLYRVRPLPDGPESTKEGPNGWVDALNPRPWVSTRSARMAK